MISKKNILMILLFVGLFIKTFGQQSLEAGRVEPYRLEVTYNKTCHLIFPVAIRYTDLGSNYLIAEKAEDAQNVLRIKAAVKDFAEETNFSVITEDGQFYSFNVIYNADPSTLSYDLKKMKKDVERSEGRNVQFEELGFNPPSLTEVVLKTIYQQNKRYVRHIAARSYGIQSILKGIYVHNGKFYFHLEAKNRSNVPFVVDFCTYKIVDKQIAKRTVSEEKQLVPVRQYPGLEVISDNSVAGNVILLDQFTITDEQVLRIEIFERNGARNQVLEIENSDLVAAKPVSEMKIKVTQ
ncbi:Bacteroides conjugative transposon TraN protein [Sphingobacterium multivorum]|uniref:Bacteroides conjugative transposon TraN protein n=3 Tax=Bacteroidota/Chlorobiota group TaxID=68336 RepID=A0A2X2JTC7_SPHMU|nr:conjugative transposon protein TraN [Chryseobacterium bernardetii]AZB25136.1 conjugative transposon protein TraN [Chryseobacterium bernardetii]QRQ63224.1 conjugative transposon protein TraN [Sphingobacterium multivorum]SPZ95063.1 Bacteroides conjugative transposon TraN protein [Sphingobacterium multivorum]